MNLEDCKIEMRRIVDDLREIEWAVRHNFEGIGEQLCANCIGKMADKYAYIYREMCKVDENLISQLIQAREL